MTFRHFEREFLRLVFTTSVEISPSRLAFLLDLPVVEAERHMRALVDTGVLELVSDDDGRLGYAMPDRGSTFGAPAPALPVNALMPYVSQHLAPVGSGHAALSLVLSTLR